MATGLTPTLNALIAAGNCVFRLDGRSGSFYERQTGTVGAVNNVSFPILISRKGMVPASTNGNCFWSYGVFPGIDVGDLTIMIGHTGLVANAFGKTIDNGKFKMYHNAGSSRWDVTSNNLTTSHSGNGSAPLGRRHNICLTRASGANGVTNWYINGVAVGTANQNSGTPEAGTYALRLFEAIPGIHEFVYVFNTIPSAANIALLADELDNNIQYEQKSITINGVLAAGQPYWIARYGILAGETTMSAGQELGQLGTLKVSTGTHKCSTFLYGTKLAKGIQCVTAGNIVLPNPHLELGGTYYYKYYTNATTTWSDATSATPTITLAAAGDRILWATYDGKTCLYKAL